jgi:hypothetical protein
VFCPLCPALVCGVCGLSDADVAGIDRGRTRRHFVSDANRQVRAGVYVQILAARKDLCPSQLQVAFPLPLCFVVGRRLTHCCGRRRDDVEESVKGRRLTEIIAAFHVRWAQGSGFKAQGASAVLSVLSACVRARGA